jgi:hypothetical protein
MKHANLISAPFAERSFDSQDQLQNHLKSCTQKKISFNPAIMPLMAGHGTFRAVIRSNTHLFKVECEKLINLIYQ